MKVYEYGEKKKKTVMILPSLYSNNKDYEENIKQLEKNYHICLVSYTGFNEETEKTFNSVFDETIKIEEFIKRNLGGKLDLLFGISFGERIVNQLVSRNEISIKSTLILFNSFYNYRIIPIVKAIVSIPTSYFKIKKNTNNIRFINIYKTHISNALTKNEPIIKENPNVNIIITKNKKDMTKNKLNKYYHNPTYIDSKVDNELDLLKRTTEFIYNIKHLVDKKQSEEEQE